MNTPRFATQKETFFRRWRERALSQRDFERIFFVLLVIALPGGGSEVFINAERGLYDAMQPLMFGLIIPFAIGFYLLAYRSYLRVGIRYSKFIWFSFPVAATIVFSLLLPGNLLWINAFSASWKDTIVQGPITQTRTQGKGRTSYFVIVSYNGHPVELKIHRKEYQQLNVGEVYSREMKLGGLGYYWDWRLR